MAKNDGGPAFPRPMGKIYDGEWNIDQEGMTLRDYFATHASESDIFMHERDGDTMFSREQARYRYADAMLKTRDGDIEGNGHTSPPTKPILPWSDGPSRGNDPVERGEVMVGDRYLVLVAVRTRHKQGLAWEPHVIIATESGWDDPNGDSWGAWSWSDVEYFIRLDNKGYLPSVEAAP